MKKAVQKAPPVNESSILSRSNSLKQRQYSCESTSKSSGRGVACVNDKLVSIQPKLRISPANDVYEQEADRVADQVVSMSTPGGSGHSPIRIQRLVGQTSELSNISVPKSVNRALAGNGNPMEPKLRHEMEQRFGYDFSRVRIHSDTIAQQSAEQVNAHAYTVGSDIVFGRGEPAFETKKGTKLLAHELTHSIQQQAGSKGASLQRDIIDDVEDNLSYSFVDWAVTDSEAMESLALLGTIDPVNLAAEIGRLDSKYTTRLLDNLPDAAKTGDVYERVITAIGAKGVEEHVTDQLSYGLFDWAITDLEVTRVFNTFVTLPAVDQEQLLANLNSSGSLSRLIDNSTTAHHTLYIRPWINSLTPSALTQQQRDLLLVIIKNTPDNEIKTLKALLQTRFDVTVGQTTQANLPPVDWVAKYMRTAYLALDQLPEAHVAHNKELLRLGQFQQASRQVGASTLTTVGVYSPSQRELAINTEASGDISDTIRHETAHAVDQEMGWSKGPEPAKHSRGGWKTYGANHNDCATDMVTDSNGGIKSDISAAQQADVITQMATAMGNRSVATLEQNIRNLPWFAGLNKAKKASVTTDKAIKAVGVGLVAPWFNATGGGEHLGNHVYQESYTPTWVRYRHEARSRFISKYQFRDQGEWFAEAYDCYYEPDSRGLGAKLNVIDPNTKTYFDNFVHTRAFSR